jgi:hypothetical protein
VNSVRHEDLEEDTMYPATQDAITAQIAYRQNRLAADYRRGAHSTTRRWHRSRHAGAGHLS